MIRCFTRFQHSRHNAQVRYAKRRRKYSNSGPCQRLITVYKFLELLNYDIFRKQLIIASRKILFSNVHSLGIVFGIIFFFFLNQAYIQYNWRQWEEINSDISKKYKKIVGQILSLYCIYHLYNTWIRVCRWMSLHQ